MAFTASTVPSLAPEEVILVAAGVLIGATLQSTIGFGFALIAGPAAFAVTKPAEAITILLTLGVILSALVMLAERRTTAIRRGDVVHILGWAAPGVVAGVLILVALTKPTLQVVVGASVIFAAAVQARRIPPHESYEGSRAARALAGLTAGTLTTTTAASGPPIVLFLQSTGVRPEAFRDTMAALLLGLNVMGTVVLVAAGGRAELPQFALMAVLVSLVALGHRAGRILFERFDPGTFRSAGVVLIVFSGVASIAAGIAA